ncbi:CBS domain-containing protein [Catenulispora sp. MAP12-49]|jgi:CBS domain-containing protein|uniref:CBS domain-containing protein n=1 Tax=unclassified Catenulispora TaxID=414885 RepID=UPI00351317F4
MSIPSTRHAAHVVDAMSTEILMIGPRHTLRQAAQRMTQRGVGSAVVHNPETSGIGIITERDILHALGGGRDADTECVEGHLTSDVVFATPRWTLEQAAEAMTRGGFRHLIVVDGDEVVGMISVRDIVRAWTRVPSHA